MTDPDPGVQSIDEHRSVTLLGATFRVADKIGLMPLLRFSHMAAAGISTDDMEAMSTMYDLLCGVIADDDWAAFQNHASKVRADQDDLLGAVRDAIEAMTARPTVRPSDSSDGPPNTGTSSPVLWSSQESSTPPPATESPVARLRLAPLLDDPRVKELLPLEEAAAAV